MLLVFTAHMVSFRLPRGKAGQGLGWLRIATVQVNQAANTCVTYESSIRPAN